MNEISALLYAHKRPTARVSGGGSEGGLASETGKTQSHEYA